MLNTPDVREQLNKHGLTPMPGTREELANTIERDLAMRAGVITEGTIAAE